MLLPLVNKGGTERHTRMVDLYGRFRFCQYLPVMGWDALIAV